VEIFVNFFDFFKGGVQSFEEAGLEAQISGLKFVLIGFENDLYVIFGVEGEKVLQFGADCRKSEYNGLIGVHCLMFIIENKKTIINC
jgi:hypothetical protein